jgi:RNA-dependent RNA polymerase
MEKDCVLVLHVIADWSDCRFKGREVRNNEEAKSREMKNQLARIIRKFDESLWQIQVVLQNKSKSNLYYETESISRFTATISFRGKKTEEQVRYFLSALLSHDDIQGMYFSADPSTEHLLYDMLSLKKGIVSQKKRVKSFKLGTVVGVGNIVSVFDSTLVDSKQLIFYEHEVHFRHDMASLSLHFFDEQRKPAGEELGCDYELKIKYEHIHSIVVFPDKLEMEVTFILKCPPLLYKKFRFLGNREKDQHAYIREPSFSMRLVKNARQRNLTNSNFGKCNAISIHLNYVCWGSLCPWNILSVLKGFLDFRNTSIPFYFCRTKTVHETSLSPSMEIFTEEESLPLMMTQDFDVIYAMKICLNFSHQYLADLTLPRNSGKSDWHLFCMMLHEKYKENRLAVELTFYEIFQSLQRNCFVHILRDFTVIFKSKVQEARNEKHDSPRICKIRRAVLTPTRVILMPPHPYVRSRIFTVCNPDYAARMLLRDDDGNMLQHNIGLGTNSSNQQIFLKKAVTEPIVSGIKIGHRRYEFLSSTTSQMREHGIILYSMDNDQNRAREIRDKMGDFSQIKNPGKYISRLGQTFSQMIAAVQIDGSVEIIQEDDIVHKDALHPKSGKPYNFSDGVGKVSSALAKKFAEALDLLEVPSAFQIRYKGYKGLVVVDPTLQGLVLSLRQSMNKFDAATTSLEILKVSEPRAVFLNRPLICLLDQLGVDYVVLELLLNRAIKKLAQTFLNENSALEMLSNYSSFLLALFEVKVCYASGISILSDPLLRKILELIVRKNLKELKEKARLPVPFNSGRNMFGCVDEYRVLEYGQVFLQYTTEAGMKIHTGRVMVTKNPCMHPGDVRMFTAVNRPELHHIRDCIVFPQKGHRPHPDEMAGSDLDGDEYTVIWMEELFIKKNCEAMVFPDHPVENLDVQEIEDEHTLQFICKFIQENRVGLIANAHLALSDLKENGIFDNLCFKLCQKYSIAVDFPKTTINVSFEADDRPKEFPDFMEKGAEKSTYMSDRALGKLYRKISLFELAFSDSLPDIQHEWELNPDLILEGWEKYEKVALEDYNHYSSRIASCLKEMSVESEVSLLSAIFELDSQYFSGKNDATDAQKTIELVVKQMMKDLRSRFETLPEGEDYDYEEILKKASAYYIISHRMNKAMEVNSIGNFNDIDTGKRLYAFHWIASSGLAAISRRKNGIRAANEEEMNIQSTPKRGIIISIRKKVVSEVDQYIKENFSSNENKIQTLASLSEEDVIEVSNRFLQIWFKNHPIRQYAFKWKEGACQLKINELLKKAYNDMRESELRNGGSDMTPGNIIIETLTQIIDSWIMEHNGKEHILIGLAAINSMSRVCHSHSIDPLKPVNDNLRNLRSFSPNDLRMRQFHISLQANPDFTELVNKFPNEILECLKDASGVTDITANRHSQGSYQFWLITAIGTQWQLEILKNYYLFRKKFFKVITSLVLNKIEEKKDSDLQNLSKPK